MHLNFRKPDSWRRGTRQLLGGFGFPVGCGRASDAPSTSDRRKRPTTSEVQNLEADVLVLRKGALVLDERLDGDTVGHVAGHGVPREGRIAWHDRGDLRIGKVLRYRLLVKGLKLWNRDSKVCVVWVYNTQSSVVDRRLPCRERRRVQTYHHVRRPRREEIQMGQVAAG